MIAVFVMSPSSAVSVVALSFAAICCVLAIVVVVGDSLLVRRRTHQARRRTQAKRVAAGLATALAIGGVLIGHTAVVTSVCDWAWWALECWLYRG